jgi:hypothetical protein
MEKLLRVTNALLALIALCLVLIVANIYRVDLETTAYAAPAAAQPVYLVYWDESKKRQEVVGQSGLVPVWQHNK